MEINDITKQIIKMPILLKRTLNALTPEQRDAFVAGFAAEVANKEAVSERAGNRPPLRRPNFTRDTERLVASLSKRKSSGEPA